MATLEDVVMNIHGSYLRWHMDWNLEEIMNRRV